MNTVFFTPGPSQLYPKYKSFLDEAMNLQIGSINHRSSAFREIYSFTDRQLRKLMEIPSTHAIFFTASATEIWERILLNCVDKYSFHLINGSFSKKFYDFGVHLQKSPAYYSVKEGEGFDIDAIEIPEQTELICTTQNETSTGVQLPVNDLEHLAEKYPHALICSDLVSSAPYADINYSKIDSTFFSVQKAFGMPPGLGVWIAGERCRSRSRLLIEKNINMGAHHMLESFYENYSHFETPSTPNVMAIFILGKIAEDMNLKGIASIRNEIDAKAELIYTFAGSQPGYRPYVNEVSHRSKTVALLSTEKSSSEIISKLQEFDMTVGSGYGKQKANQIRIANFPATSYEELKKLLEVLAVLS